MTCKNCKYDKFAVDEMDGAQFHWCDRYLDNYEQDKAESCLAYKPKSNADKIRNMKDEELADFLLYDEGDFCGLCEYYGTTCDGYGCREAMIKWLKQTVKGE